MRGLRRTRNDQRPASDHERARTAAAERIIEELPDDEAAWLEAHLAGCPACRAVADAYAVQALAIRALPLPDPPRDLWARTAAALDAEVRRDTRAGRRRGRQAGRSFGSAPFGALAGAMVVVVVVGAALLADRGLFTPLIGPGGGAPATPFVVEPQDVAWLAPLPDGTYALNFARLDRVCPAGATPDCAPIDASARKVITLTAAPRAVLRSPARAQYVVVDAATTSVGGTVYVVPVAGTDEASPPGPSGTPLAIATATPSATEASATATGGAGESSAVASPQPAPTVSAGPDAAPTSPRPSEPAGARTPTLAAATPTLEPATSPADATPTPEASAGEAESGPPTATSGTEPGSPEPSASNGATGSVVVSPSPSTSGGPTEPIAIISNAVVVGETAAYSPDGSWFAFTARPADASHGPDIYVWHSGDLTARPVTSDHGSIFSSWLGDRIVGSRPAGADLVFEPAPSPAGSSPAGSSPAGSSPAGSAPSGAPATSSSPLPTESGQPSTSPGFGVVIGDAPPAPSPASPSEGDEADATASPGDARSSSPSASGIEAGTTPAPGSSNASSPGPSPSPSPEVSPLGAPSVARPLSFVIDPATGLETDLLGAPAWRPVIDPTGRWVVYWSGSITYDTVSQTWNPLDGGLVVAPVSALAGSAVATILPTPTLETSPETSPSASGMPSASEIPGMSGLPESSPTALASPGVAGSGPTDTSPSLEPEPGAPSATPEPSPASPMESPGGSPAAGASPTSDAGSPAEGSGSPSAGATPLAPLTGPEPLLPVDPSTPPAGPLRDWDVRFDPTGSRLAVWTADAADPSVGRLSLFAFNSLIGRIDPSGTLLADQPALLGYSLDAGRIAWATPPGQDGGGSRLQILAWLGEGSGRLTANRPQARKRWSSFADSADRARAVEISSRCSTLASFRRLRRPIGARPTLGSDR